MGLNEKLFDIQKAIPPITKDGNNPHFGNDYVTLNELLAVTIPIFQENGVLFSQAVTTDGYSQPALETKFVDVETGETDTSIALLILDKQTPQAVGSAITYQRRYSLMSKLGLVGVDEDDDGEAASRSTKTTSGGRGRKKLNDASSTPPPRF